MKTREEIIEDVREKMFAEEQQKREELAAWKTMPAYVTQKRVEQLEAFYAKKTLPAEAKIMLRVNIPNGMSLVTYCWSCFLEVTCDGKTLIKEYASAEFCEGIFNDKTWKEEGYGNLSFFVKPLQNKVKVKRKNR